MARSVPLAVVLRYLSDLERTGAAVVYLNNAPLPIEEARARLAQVSHAYLHRGMVYVP